MENLKWWQKAVFYQIYPRSFADGNGDGIGDFKGMIEHLDYLQGLGIDGLWLSPHYPSPQFDCGYDISDYQGVNPEYGALDDFKQFLDGAHQRGMRVILDLVLNHTSDQNPWFIASRSSRDNPKRDWYVWRDGKKDGPPNNWYSTFGGQAWEYDQGTGQYYYHYFFKEQPDLNWRNPEVKQAMWEAVCFWLDLGVDGFRLDAIGTIYEDPALPDHPVKESLSDLYRHVMTGNDLALEFEVKIKALFQYQVDLPEVHDLMKELRQLIDSYPDRMLIGETEEISFYGSGDDELNMVFNFPLMETEKLTPATIRANQKTRLAALPRGAWPCNTLGNHDSPRVKSRYGDGKNDDALARLHLALILTMRGTPFIYNGEEIGMTNLLFDDISQLRDNVGLFVYRTAIAEIGLTPDEGEKLAIKSSRDKGRTPMQWANRANAGFSPAGVAPWLPVNPNYSGGINVADQEKYPASLLNFYRAMIQLRKQTPALIGGEYLPLHENAEEYIAFLRQSIPNRQSCLVILNMSDQHQTLKFDLEASSLKCLFSTSINIGSLSQPFRLEIAPFGIYMGELSNY